MNNRFLTIIPLIASSAMLITGCGDNSAFETPAGDSTIPENSGTVALKNFSLLSADSQPTAIDRTTGIFTKTDVVLTAFVADRLDATLTDGHTVYFRAEAGVLNPSSCTTADGFCTVTWSIIKNPGIAANANGDIEVTIMAYTAGEESFPDSNGNGIYDDADGNQFSDQAEPYIDVDESNSFTAGDKSIDTINGFDSTGADLTHNPADGLFNGTGCTHTTLCSTTVTTNATIWDSTVLTINGPPPATP